MISLAEEIILIYNEYMNNEISETVLIREVSRVVPEISTLYYRETELDIPPDDMVERCNQCSLIAACIHDMTLYYSKETFLNRTPENRKSCMDISIDRYYKDLENLREIEKTCEHESVKRVACLKSSFPIYMGEEKLSGDCLLFRDDAL